MLLAFGITGQKNDAAHHIKSARGPSSSLGAAGLGSERLLLRQPSLWSRCETGCEHHGHGVLLEGSNSAQRRTREVKDSRKTRR